MYIDTYLQTYIQVLSYLYKDTSAGWFKNSKPPRTYTNHTITKRARCVGCALERGGSSTANLIEPHETHQHRASKVFCGGVFPVGSLRFAVLQQPRTTTLTSSNLHEPHQQRASKVCRVLMH